MSESSPPRIDDRELDDRPSKWIGRVLDDRYEIVREIGAGGMGRVYEARQLRIIKSVAIKMLSPALAVEPYHVRNFLREARAASAIRHPNVIDIVDFGTEPAVYFVMELLAGRDLSRVVATHGPLPWARARPILVQVANALAAAHACDVIHRDIKPGNVFVLDKLDDYGREVVKVLDFGIAKTDRRLVSGLTETRAIVGTVHYMAPEQAAGRQVDARVDVYSLGVLAYKMLTGHLPFEAANPFGVLEKQLLEPPPPVSAFGVHLPAEVDELLRTALCPAADGRWPTMAAFEAAMRAIPTDEELLAQAEPDDDSPTRLLDVDPDAVTTTRAGRRTKLEPTQWLGPQLRAVPPSSYPTDRLEVANDAEVIPATQASPELTSNEPPPAPRRRWPWLVSAIVAPVLGGSLAAWLIVQPADPSSAPAPTSAAPPTIAPPLGEPRLVPVVPSREPSPATVEPLPRAPTPIEPTLAEPTPTEPPPEPMPEPTPTEPTPSVEPESPDATEPEPPAKPITPTRKPPRAPKAMSLPIVARNAATRCRKTADSTGAQVVHASFTINSSGGTMLISTDTPYDRGALASCVKAAIADAKFPPGTLRTVKIDVKF